jgi:hypothetical protein
MFKLGVTIPELITELPEVVKPYNKKTLEFTGGGK